MNIVSTRFGTLEVEDETTLTFPDGLIGLPGSEYAILAQSEESPFFWLQSAEQPEVALPIAIPWLFFSDYELSVPEEDARRLELESGEQADVFCVVKAADRLEGFTINLLAPLVVNRRTRIGRQIINDGGGYSPHQPLFTHVALSDVSAALPVVPVTAAR